MLGAVAGRDTQLAIDGQVPVTDLAGHIVQWSSGRVGVGPQTSVGLIEVHTVHLGQDALGSQHLDVAPVARVELVVSLERRPVETWPPPPALLARGCRPPAPYTSIA